MILDYCRLILIHFNSPPTFPRSFRNFDTKLRFTWVRHIVNRLCLDLGRLTLSDQSINHSLVNNNDMSFDWPNANLWMRASFVLSPKVKLLSRIRHYNNNRKGPLFNFVIPTTWEIDPYFFFFLMQRQYLNLFYIRRTMPHKSEEENVNLEIDNGYVPTMWL